MKRLLIIVAIVGLFSCPLRAQSNALPKLDAPSSVREVLDKYFAQHNGVQNIGALPILFPLHVGSDKLRFLQVEENGIFLTTDNIPLATRYSVLPISPSIDKILVAKTFGEIVREVAGKDIKNSYMIFGNQLVKAALDNQKLNNETVTLHVCVAYPLGGHLGMLKLKFRVLPEQKSAEERKIDTVDLETNFIDWYDPVPMSSDIK